MIKETTKFVTGAIQGARLISQHGSLASAKKAISKSRKKDPRAEVFTLEQWNEGLAKRKAGKKVEAPVVEVPKGSNIVDSAGNGCHRRLWSLPDIMTKFDIAQYTVLVVHLDIAESSLQELGRLKTDQQPTKMTETVVKLFNDMVTFCMKAGFSNTTQAARFAYNRIKGDDPDVSTLLTEIRSVRHIFLTDPLEHRFVHVREDRADYFEADALFGVQVHEAFPSARDDIREAGNCLSVEVNTAAVFHLMRVAEIGLRSLAHDRGLKCKKGPLELQEWSTLIQSLEKAEHQIQSFPRTSARETQFEFYHGALMEFRALKNVWRHRVAHARESYDRDQAMSAMNHVGEFMRILAKVISEGERSPTRWTANFLRQVELNCRPFKWKGITRYRCRACSHDFSSIAEIEKHVADAHGLKPTTA